MNTCVCDVQDSKAESKSGKRGSRSKRWPTFPVSKSSWNKSIAVVNHICDGEKLSFAGGTQDGVSVGMAAGETIRLTPGQS